MNEIITASSFAQRLAGTEHWTTKEGNVKLFLWNKCADDCFAAATYIQGLRGKRLFLVYGISSGALRAALFAQRHPGMVARLALDAFVWTGEGSPTLAERKKKLPEFS